MKKYTVVLMWIFILGNSCIYAQNGSIWLDNGEKIKIIFEQKTLRQPEADYYKANGIPIPLKVYFSFPKRWETNYFSDMSVYNGEFDYKIISGNADIMATVDGPNSRKCNGGFKGDPMAISWLADQNAVNCPQTAHHVVFLSGLSFDEKRVINGEIVSVSIDSVVEFGSLYFMLPQESEGFQVQAGMYPLDVNEGSLNRVILNLRKKSGGIYIDRSTGKQDWGGERSYTTHFEFIPGGLTILSAPEISLRGDSLTPVCPMGELSAFANIQTVGAAIHSSAQIQWQYAEAATPTTWVNIIPDSNITILNPDFIAKGETKVSMLKVAEIPNYWNARLLRCVVEDDEQNIGYMEAKPIKIHTLAPLYLIIDSASILTDRKPIFTTEMDTWNGSPIKVFTLPAFNQMKVRPSSSNTPNIADIPTVLGDSIYEYVRYINVEEFKPTPARYNIISVLERPTYYYARTYRTPQKCLVTTDTVLVKPEIKIEAPTFRFSSKCFGGGGNRYTVKVNSNLIGKTAERWEWIIRTDELLNIEDSIYTVSGTNYAAKLRSDDVDKVGVGTIYQLQNGADNISTLIMGINLVGSSLPYTDLFEGALYPAANQGRVWANKFLYVRYFVEGEASPWAKKKIAGPKSTFSDSTPDTLVFLVNGVRLSGTKRDILVNVGERISIARTGFNIDQGTESGSIPAEVFRWEREDPLNSGQWYFEKKNAPTGAVQFVFPFMSSLSARYRVRLSVGACDTVSQPITIYVRPDTLPLYAMEASSLLLSEELADANPLAYSDIYENDDTQPKAAAFSPIKNDAVGNSHILSILPNPMRERAELTYEVLEDGKLSLKLYTLLGECVQTLIEAEHIKGMYHKTIDVEALPNGIYFLRLESYCKGKMQTEISKIILRK